MRQEPSPKPQQIHYRFGSIYPDAKSSGGAKIVVASGQRNENAAAPISSPISSTKDASEDISYGTVEKDNNSGTSCVIFST